MNMNILFGLTVLAVMQAGANAGTTGTMNAVSISVNFLYLF